MPGGRGGGDDGSAVAASGSNAAGGSGGSVETLAEAIERVWARRRCWPERKEQQREARDRGNWASLWVLVTDVAQPSQTRGTDVIMRITVTDESFAAATERARARVAEARVAAAAAGGADAAALAQQQQQQHPLANVHWPGGVQLSVFATPCAVSRLMRTLQCGGQGATPGGQPGAVLRLSNVVVQGWDDRPQLFGKLGVDVEHPLGAFGVSAYPRRDPADGSSGASDVARPAGVTSSSLAAPRAGDAASAGRLAALRLLAARRDAEMGDPDAAMVRHYGATSVPAPLEPGGGGGGYGFFGGAGGFGGGGPPPPQAQQQRQRPPPGPPQAPPPPLPAAAAAHVPDDTGACAPDVFGGGAGWAAAQQQRVTRQQAAVVAVAGAATAAAAPTPPAAAAAPPPPAHSGGMAQGIAAAVTGVFARAFGGGGAVPDASAPAAATAAAAAAAAASAAAAPPPPPPALPAARPRPPPPHMAPSLSSLRLPEADHEAPGLVDVRARVVALDTTSEDGVVVCWLWDGTDVVPLPEHATCAPAIHQGEPIREPEPEDEEQQQQGEEEALAALDGRPHRRRRRAPGPVPRPLPLRSAPGVQVLGAPTVLAAGDAGADAAMARLPLPLRGGGGAPPPPAALLASAAATTAARLLTAPELPPVGSAVPLIILPVMRGSRVHGGQGQQQQQQQQQQKQQRSSSLTPRLDAQSLPAPGAWIKLRHLALQVAPGGEIQLLYGTPSKMSLVSAPGSAGGDGAAAHLELRLAERLVAPAGEEPASAWARAAGGGARVAALLPDEVSKAVRRAREIDDAVRLYADAAQAAAGGLVCDEEEDGENAPPPPPPPPPSSSSPRKLQQQQRQQQDPSGSATATATATTAAGAIPLVTLRQLLSGRERGRARADAAALAARDAADGYAPRRAYFTRAVRVVARVASLRPADLVAWARPVPSPGRDREQQQQQWALCGRAALADGTSAGFGPPPGLEDGDRDAGGVVVAFVAPETSEALLGVDAGPLDGRDARSRDRLARLAASVARLQAVGPPPPAFKGGGGGGGGAGAAATTADQAEDGGGGSGEPTAWIEALIVPRVRLPSEPGGDDWSLDYLLTGARLRPEEEVETEEEEQERARRQQRRGAGAGAGSAADGAAALAAAVRDAVAAAQLEAAARRAGSSPVAAGRRPLPVEEEAAEEEGGGGRAKRRRRGGGGGGAP